MREALTLSRRAVAATLPFAIFSRAIPAAAAAIDAPVHDIEGIEAAANRCRAARQALADATDAFERSVPPPNETLDMTGRRPWPFAAAAERRGFDGKTPKRALDALGNPGERHVATVATIEQDLLRCPAQNRGRRRLLYRMRRRAKARAARIEALEASFGLNDLQWQVDEAEHALEQQAQTLFAEPATSMAGVLVQARGLSIYSSTMQQQYAGFQAGRFGNVLAEGLQHVARAA